MTTTCFLLLFFFKLLYLSRHNKTARRQRKNNSAYPFVRGLRSCETPSFIVKGLKRKNITVFRHRDKFGGNFRKIVGYKNNISLNLYVFTASASAGARIQNRHVLLVWNS